MNALTMVVALWLSQDGGASAGTTVELVVKDITPQAGTLMIGLYDKAEGFPGAAGGRIRKLVSVTGATQKIVFENVPPGTWAAAVAHDANGNGKLDTKIFGIPAEPVGTSNDAPARFGPPKFDDAKFVVADKPVSLPIKLALP